MGNRQGTNTFGKDKKFVKTHKKIPKEDNDIINAHGVFMKGIVIGVTMNDPSKGLSPIERPKEFKRKKLKKVSNHVFLTMTDLIGARSTTVSTTKEGKYITPYNLHKAKVKSHASNVPLEFVPLRVFHPNKDEEKTPKPYEPSNIYAPKNFPIVLKHNIEISKTWDEENDNINQTIKTLNARDYPPIENIIDKSLVIKLVHVNLCMKCWCKP